MRRAIPVLLLVCAVFAPSAALGQTRPQPRPATQARPPVPKKSRVAVRAYGFYDFEALAASKTFDAVAGSSTLNSFGGGVEVLNIWRKAFVRMTFAHGSKDGQRVFVNSGTVFPLGIPLTVGMTPIELGGGWRTTVDKKGLTGVYVGAGVVFLNYSETVTGAGATSADNTSVTFTGYSIFGGVDRSFHKYLFAGAEAQYRGLPNAIGTAGVSQSYNETNLGGFAIRVLFGIKK
jgi:hypothetical protein